MYIYYLKNIHWGLIIYGIAVYLMRDNFNEPKVKVLLVIFFFNLLLFPFAKKRIERLVLKYSSRQCWTTGFYTETPMKSGVYAFFTWLYSLQQYP